MTGSKLLRPRADFIRIIEACYAREPDDHAWSRAVIEAVGAVFARPLGAGMQIVEHDGVGKVERILVDSLNPTPDYSSLLTDIQESGMAPALRALWFPPALAQSVTELGRWKAFTPEGRTYVADFFHRLGFGDAIGIAAHPEPGLVSILFIPIETPHILSRYERALLSQVALHMESAVRLRRRPERVIATISCDGRVLDGDDRGPFVAASRKEAVVVEASRTSGARKNPSAIDLWRALVAGQVSLAERTDVGRRAYVVLENPPSSVPLRCLSPKEAKMAAFAARGLSNKLIAYALGVSPSVVSHALWSAAAKLGAPSRAALVRVASSVAVSQGEYPIPEPSLAPENPTARLTPAERDILELVRAGMSNRAIAEARGRSERTVANQVSALLRKTQSATRRGLVVTH